MISQTRILNVVGSLYESAREGSCEAWRDTYSQIARLFSSGPGSLSLLSAADGHVDFIATTYSQECVKAFDTIYRHINPLRKKISQMPVGETLWRLRDCPDPEFINTEFYQDFLQKEDVYDIRYFKISHRSGMDAMISFTRPKTIPFKNDDLAAMSFIFPHLQRALQIFLTVADVKAYDLYLKEIVSKSPRGVILLNRSGKAVYCNDAAENVIASNDGLEFDRNKCLQARQSQDMQKLRTVLQSVFDPEPGHAVCNGGFLQVSRPSGLRPFQLHISPLPKQNFAGYSPENIALVFVFDPEQRFETVEDLLRRMYGLTHTEAQLTGMLAKGLSLKEAGELLHVKPSTIHTHMKHIFAKTDCKRQGELITLVFNGLAGLKNLERSP